MIRLALADDERLFLSGLEHLLSSEPDFDVLMTSPDGSRLLELLGTAALLPHIVLLDLRMKPMNGLDTAGSIQKKYPDMKVIILSSHYSDSFLGYMMKLGVSAFFPKDIPPSAVVTAIRRVHESGVFFTDGQVKAIREQFVAGRRPLMPGLGDPVDLTRREREILELICEQMNSQEIAEKLFISPRTVEGHRNSLLLKTGVQNSVGLAVYALLFGLVDVNKKLLEYTSR